MARAAERIWDAIVVGAGVAGLAAARELRRGGAQALVLEARRRIGGRVLTHHHPELSVPIELGAEFVHGLGPRTLARIDDEALPVVEIDDHHLALQRDGSLRERSDFFRLVYEIASRIRPGRDDRPVGEAIRDLRLPESERALVLEYVRGFHAADPELLSARAFAEAERDAGGLRRQLRFVRGYAGIVHALARDLEPDAVRLGASVRALRWSRGAVEADVDGAIVRARAAILTVPVGVLRARPGEPGAIAIEPRPAVLDRALGAIEVGAVCRVALRLRRPLEDVLGRARVAFVHARDPDFPVWWTPYPLRAPLVVAWCGGPRAHEVARDPVRRAIDALGRWLGPAAAHELVIEGYNHDWLADPFARGAYSYVAAGGLEDAGALAEPIASTLWLAGEAWSEGESGTVEGAIASGERAGRQVVDRLAPRPRRELESARW